MSIVIREARVGDENTIFSLLKDMAVFEKLTHIFDLTHQIIARDFLGPQKRLECEIAEWDGKPVALMIWFRTYGTFRARPVIYLEDIYVDEQYRGRGIGKAFFKRLAQHAVKEDATRIDWIVLDWNARAIQFYESIGGPIIDDWRLCRLSGDAMQKLAAS